MAKTKSKVKFDFKNFLLKKGEYLAMGVAGFFLFLLLLWGVTKWSGANDPAAIHKELTSRASSVQSQIASDQVTDSDRGTKLPPGSLAPSSSRGVGLGLRGDQPAVRPDRQARHQKENRVLPMGTTGRSFAAR